nr:hypothetical protein [Tanacetum cinerariifolium]
MAALKYKEEHNKVGYLLKPTSSDDHHQIIDFLTTLKAPELGPPAILATIDNTPYTISEELVRSRLQLADDGGNPMPLLPAMLLQAAAVEVHRPQSPHPVAPILEHDHSSTQPKTATGSFLSTKDAPLGGDFHTSPLRSSHTPPASQPSGGAEDPITLATLSSVVSTLVQKVHSLEAELHDHKRLFKDVVGKLVKKVKSLEVKLKIKKRKMVLSDSDEEDDTTPNVDLDALRALVNAGVAVDSDVLASPYAPTDLPTATSTTPTGASRVAVGASVVATGVAPSNTYVAPGASRVAPGGSIVSPDVFVAPTSTLAVPADSTNIPTAVPADRLNVHAGTSNKGKYPMIEKDIPVPARTFRQKEEDRLGSMLEEPPFKKPKSPEAPTPSMAEISIPPAVATPPSSRTRRKSIARKHVYKPKSKIPTLDFDAPSQAFLKVIVDEDSDDADSVDEVWSDVVGWGILSTPLDVPYPLSVKLMKKMLLHKLEIDLDFVGNDMTTAEQVFNSPMLHLLRVEMVLNSPWIMPILGIQELASPNANGFCPEQTATGKDVSNPFMAVMICQKSLGYSNSPLIQVLRIGLVINQPGYIVPTGRVMVPTGRVIVTTGRVIITIGRCSSCWFSSGGALLWRRGVLLLMLTNKGWVDGNGSNPGGRFGKPRGGRETHGDGDGLEGLDGQFSMV